MFNNTSSKFQTHSPQHGTLFNFSELHEQVSDVIFSVVFRKHSYKKFRFFEFCIGTCCCCVGTVR